jgi:hypothetical protein
MASHEVLRDIVRNGSDLILTTSISYEVIRELAALASASGAKLTVTTAMSYEFVREPSSEYGKSIAFMNGLDNYEKPSK